ncbi:MAG: hypothetical protein ACO20H_13205 [Bacteriovoracaceae bacterium]
MKKLIFLLLLLTQTNLMANSVMFQSLSQQSCLYTFNDKEFLLASFNDGKASRIPLHFVEELNQSAQKISGIDGLEQKAVYLHCGAYGSSLVFNLQQHDRGVCIWVGHNNGQFKIKDIGPLDPERAGFCDGVRAGTLLFIYAKPMSSDEVKEGLEQSGLSDKVLEYSALSQKIFKVSFQKDYAYEVFLLKKEIQDMDIPYLKVVEAENLYHPIGDYRLLEWP